MEVLARIPIRKVFTSELQLGLMQAYLDGRMTIRSMRLNRQKKRRGGKFQELAFEARMAFHWLTGRIRDAAFEHSALTRQVSDQPRFFSSTGHCIAPVSGMDKNIIMDGKAGRPDLGARMCWRPLFMRIKKIGESA